MKKFKITAAAFFAAVLMMASGCSKEKEEMTAPSGITDQVEAGSMTVSEDKSETEGASIGDSSEVSITEATGGDAEPATHAADGTVEGTTDSAGVDVSIIMVGDLLMHDNVSASGYMPDGTVNYDHIFAHVKDDVQAADVAVINNEVIYGGDDRGYQNYPMFNVVTPLGDAVVDAGFDVVLHASNHVLDQGTSGVENCLDFWNNKHPETAVLGIHESSEDAAEIYVYEKDGFKIAMKTLDIARTWCGIVAVGLAQRAIDEAASYVRTRVQFGKPLGRNEVIQFKLADMQMATEAARQLCAYSLTLMDRGEDYTVASATAKCKAGDAAMYCTTEAVQILGGYGFSRDYPVEKLMRDAKIFQLFEGTNEIQRLVVGRSVVGKC